MQDLSDQLVAKWTSPKGVKLMAAGAGIVGGLLNVGPLSPAKAGDVLGWPAEHVLDRFRAMDFGLETDAGGDIVGAGVSLDAERPYAMELKGQRVTGWCVMDILMFPVVFKEESSRVTGRCATTGTPISLTVTPDGVRDLTPASACLTLAPATGADIREVFCNRVNFYATTELAEAAVAADPDLAVCSVDEGWTIGKRLADLF
ncbi:organomercurial lyase [Streptomyces sp. H27-H1]|uniref:organomercurial lyase n=1 Tax=Streptomyces sp. H27-H1 TaxID=2996461 RepID=UPI00227097C3|nr:organomercurial lyase [Streptomyces sp. H27-H1]MCY0929957.1 organomercurial lyase [Streptomyces sp. H27-H1]